MLLEAKDFVSLQQYRQEQEQGEGDACNVKWFQSCDSSSEWPAGSRASHSPASSTWQSAGRLQFWSAPANQTAWQPVKEWVSMMCNFKRWQSSPKGNKHGGWMNGQGEIVAAHPAWPQFPTIRALFPLFGAMTGVQMH